MNDLAFKNLTNSTKDSTDQEDTQAPHFKASAILYISGALSLFGGVSLPLVEILSRPRDNMPRTFIELLEWNPFSEIGLVGILMGMFLFWLGIMVDRRGA